MSDWFLVLSFAAIAFVYASVGFGGGSSYLALLAVAGWPVAEMRLTALICNIIVVTGGVWLAVARRQLDFRKAWPLVAAGVPLAFLGARLRLHEDVFFNLLGISLLAAGLLLWFQPRLTDDPAARPAVPTREAALGGSIGALSGMVGIGGGIFLSPALHFLRWDTARKIAATASLFILVNSLAGIAGQLTRLPADFNVERVALLGAAVLLGGQAGSRLGITRFSQAAIRRTTAVLVFAAGLEVLFKHLF